ncbi:hypothetical protein HAX54_004591 [Datura stramonium]|uniref:Uncharacterized protein n=1 Tax=Datura stramonium TaxID=4076 RepID=A0ABS8T786_DATST|nr:hypothetical protein [Datura stramonium]
MKEKQQISLKQIECGQFQDSINKFGSLLSNMVDDGEKRGDFFDSTEKENQEVLSRDKQGEYQYQGSVKNFESLLMVNDGEKIGDLFDSAKKENQEILSRDKRDEYQYQDSMKNLESLSMVHDGDKTGEFFIVPEKLGLSRREKLKRHRREVGGRVCVPERWGYEGSLREWVDCSSFDKILAPNGLKSAREALMSQGKRARSESTSTSRMLEIRSR